MPNDIKQVRIEIADLESILANHTKDHTENELAAMEKALAGYRKAEEIYEQFLTIPQTDGVIMDAFYPAGRDKAEPFFPVGTKIEMIRKWFLSWFDLDISAPSENKPAQNAVLAECVLFTPDCSHILLCKDSVPGVAYHNVSGRVAIGTNSEYFLLDLVKAFTGVTEIRQLQWITTLQRPWTGAVSEQGLPRLVIRRVYSGIIPFAQMRAVYDAQARGKPILLIPTEDVIHASCADPCYLGLGELQYAVACAFTDLYPTREA